MKNLTYFKTHEQIQSQGIWLSDPSLIDRMEGKEKLSIPKLHTFQKPTNCQKEKVDSVKVVVGEYYYVEDARHCKNGKTFCEQNLKFVMTLVCWFGFVWGEISNHSHWDNHTNNGIDCFLFHWCALCGKLDPTWWFWL